MDFVLILNMNAIPPNNLTKRAFSYLRYSTPMQEWGDSERRQSELAKNYCRANGLELCDQVADRGISAFHGLNRENGLKKLIDSMRPGDVLLVEDTDRLSRQGWLETVNLISKILDKGVDVVTLRNNSRIDRESFARNPGTFLPVIFGGHLGNEESVKKSYRLRELWAAKKQGVVKGKAARHKFWAWLRWDDDLGKPVLIAEKAAIVRRIFSLALNGYGALAIARKLREEGMKPITARAGSWSADYVHRILTTRTAIGWHTRVDPPTPGLYPPVIDEATFWAVQNLTKSRGRNKGATVRSAADVSNLFTKIATCKVCGSSLTMHRQVSRGKNYGYLVCSGSRRSAGNCGMTSIQYCRFEASVLEILSAVGKLTLQSQEKSGPSKMDILSARLKELERQGEKIMQLIHDDENPPRKLKDELKVLQNDEDTVRELVMAEKATNSSLSAAKMWIEFRKLLPERLSDRDFRLRLKTNIRAVIDCVVVDLPAKKFKLKLRDYEEPITAELEGDNLYYVVSVGRAKSLGCCSPLKIRWKHV